MPFRSEKQRRFLWAAHTDIAKHWAHEYPKKKKLPMYEADDKDKPKMDHASDVKAARDMYMRQIKLTNVQNMAVNTVVERLYDTLRKQAGSSTVKITMPQGTKPTAAGDNPVAPAKTQQDPDSGCVTPKKPENTMLSKLSVVLSQSVMQTLENEKAEAEARNAQLMPANAGIKRYSMPAAGTPPPMGMAATAAPAAPADPAQSGQLPPVGGGSNPSANPINSYGALSSTGEINGNAAFGGPSIGKLAAAGMFSGLAGLLGRGATSAMKAAPAASTKLNLSNVHPSVLGPLASARGQAVPPELWNTISKWVNKRPAVAPADRLRIGGNHFNRFSETMTTPEQQQALARATQRWRAATTPGSSFN